MTRIFDGILVALVVVPMMLGGFAGLLYVSGSKVAEILNIDTDSFLGMALMGFILGLAINVIKSVFNWVTAEGGGR